VLGACITFSSKLDSIKAETGLATWLGERCESGEPLRGVPLRLSRRSDPGESGALSLGEDASSSDLADAQAAFMLSSHRICE
jgi:hypothetical protein